MIRIHSLALLAALSFAAVLPAQEVLPGEIPNSLKMLFRAPGGFAVSQASTTTISVVHGATLGPDEGLSSNTFSTIFVTLAEGAGAAAQNVPQAVPETKDWGNDFNEGVAPTKLAGVEVKVNGEPAFIAFTLRGADFNLNFDQVNFLTPDIDAVGPVTVKLETPLAEGETIVQFAEAAPAFFPFDPQGRKFLAAIQNDGSAFVGPEDLFGGADLGRPIRPAKPGDAVQLFAAGFGKTDPPIPAGRVATEISRIVESANLKIVVGGTEAKIFFGGLAFNLAGVYQLVIEIPNLADGDHEVIAMVGGVSSPTGLFLSVKNP